jgi:hypothetical protein
MTQLVSFERVIYATKGGEEILTDTSTESLEVANSVEVGGNVDMNTFTLTSPDGTVWRYKVMDGGILQGNPE